MAPPSTEDKSWKKRLNRREFFLAFGASVFGLGGLVMYLRSRGLDPGDGFSDEFHYFDNNLTNLHFYFLNAKIDGREIRCSSKDNSYMIVRLPQQHIAEQLLREADFLKLDQTIGNVKSKISGFSFLVFRLKQEVSLPRGKEMEALMDWSNEKLFTLVTPSPANYKTFPEGGLIGSVSGLGVKEDTGRDPLKYLTRVCAQIFVGTNFPVTVLEIPQGLLVSPHLPVGTSTDGTVMAEPQARAVFSKPRVSKQRYVFNSGRITRSVEEIWNVQMWFELLESMPAKDANGKAVATYADFGERLNPSIRPVGFIDETCSKADGVQCDERKTDPCAVDEDVVYLPGFIDKQELVYLASLGRRTNTGGTGDTKIVNAGAEWNIETKGLTFSGLGVVTKFHYKNLSPPQGRSLAEYEHHIGLGREEYIKVARLGVITCTGQKAMHVKIGQRKIINGTSFVEFKEYVEVIQTEIRYYDPSIFLPNSDPVEPGNYIHARRKDGKVEHTADDPNVKADWWQDDLLWKAKGVHTNADGTTENALPGEWDTHYRRWPFKRVNSVTTITAPIDTRKDFVPPGTLVDSAADHAKCIPCEALKPVAFWPVLEADVKKNAELSFVGTDWDDKPITFTTTFMFIRKEVFDGIDRVGQIKDQSELIDPKACVSAIYKNYFEQQPERRHIQFADAEITLTRKFSNFKNGSSRTSTEELPNKSNKAKTEFVEYYFGLCKEDPATYPNGSSRFNDRYFPLFPQVKRSKLYIDNLQSYARTPLASIVEYNSEYIQYGFEGTVMVDDPVTKQKKPVIYNKGRLVFDHTQKFLEGRERFLQLTSGGVWEEPIVADAYDKVRKAFSGAQDKIGGLVNPDFDVQSIGLVKQGVAVGKEINKKYQQLAEFDAFLKDFNPSDLFRQSPEILNGISIVDILKEAIPALEAPVNQIKDVVTDIDKLTDEIRENSFYKDILSMAQQINDGATKALALVDAAQKEVDKFNVEIEALKGQLNVDRYFPEIQSLVDTRLIQVQSSYLTFENNAVKLTAGTVDAVVDEITTDLLSHLETLRPYLQKFIDAKNELGTIIANGTEDGRKFSLAAIALIDAYRDRYLKMIFELEDVLTLGLKPLADIKKAILSQTKDAFDAYTSLPVLLREQSLAQEEYLRIRTQVALDQVTAKTTAVTTALKVIEKEVDKALPLHSQLERLKDETDRSVLAALRARFEKLHADIAPALEILRTHSLTYTADRFVKATKEYQTILSKLKPPIEAGESANDYAKRIIEEIAELDGRVKKAAEVVGTSVINERGNLKKVYDAEYDKFRNNLDELRHKSDEQIKKYRHALTDYFWVKALPDLGGLPNAKLKALRESIAQKSEFLKAEVDKLDTLRKKHEAEIKKQLEDAAGGIVETVRKRLDELHKELRSAVGDEYINDLKKKVEEGQQVYNLLTSLSRKDINFDWETTSLKSSDFGIVSFIASENPKTRLFLKVRNTIHFQEGQFPPVVDRVESHAENRLTNFGISLLKAIIVNFDEVGFTAGTNQSPKFECKVRDVEFAGPFAFVRALENCFKDLLGDNFTLDIKPSGVEIGYLLPIPYIGAPSFGFADILFRITYNLYFDSRPMELGVGIGTLANKTRLSVGIYTGFFYFNILGNPKQGITTIEISLEFGGFFGLSLGPLRGEVKLVVGLYYRKDSQGVLIEGYFLCQGQVKLWCFSITARFYMGVISRGGYVEGRCTVTYEIKLGFFKRSFSATFYKKLAGSSSGQGGGSPVARLADRSGPELAALPGAIVPPPSNPIATDKRVVRPLNRSEWNAFIESYVA